MDTQAMRQRAADAAAALAAAQARAQALEQRLSAAPARDRDALRRDLAQARSEAQLAQARRDALAALVDFGAQAGAGPSGGPGILGQIAELQKSVPQLTSPAGAAVAAARPRESASRGSGIVGLGSELLALSRELRELKAAARLTDALGSAVDRQRGPLVAEVRSALQRVGGAEGSGPDGATSRDIDAVTARFKQVTAALVPLGKLGVLLDAHAETLADWRSAVGDRYGEVLRDLALHLALVALAIAAILTASAIWHRATFRYVTDLRLRRRSLLVRRIVVGAAILLVLTFSFVSELGSVATFAGFITAGLAVALQNVILSVAAYFFLIGKYGIGVGDRVQIAGVTGDVIDVGLVRLHLMELRADGLPTGRVVVFSNSVLFQPTANFFKQIPGSNFTWHEVALTLSPDTDYRYAERRLLGAVEAVHEKYRAHLERQHDEMSQQLAPLAVHAPRPQTQLHLAESGLEMTIRFPVPLERAPDVDDEVTRALLDALDREPRLRLAGSATPTIRAVPEAAPA